MQIPYMYKFKHFWLILISLLIIFFLSFFFFLSISYFEIEKHIIFLNTQIESNVIYIILLIFFQSLIFSLGVPPTPILILNFMLNSITGLVVSFISLFISSFLIFKFSKILLNIFNLKDKIKKFRNKYLEKNIYFKVFLSRFIIPYYFHNILFGLTKVNFLYFILLSLLVDSFIIVIILFSKGLI